MLQKLYSRFFLFFVFFTLCATLVQAGESSFLRESFRARGMGHAFTAVANDEMVLYYNPAALRSVQYNAYEILKILSDVNFKEDIWSIKYINERRWNLNLKKGVKILLPEKDIINALNLIIKIQKEYKILDGNFAEVDILI